MPLLILLLPLLSIPLLILLKARASHSGLAGQGRVSRDAVMWVVLGCVLLSLLALVVQTTDVLAGAVPQLHWPWLPAQGIDLALRLDPLAYLFCLLILGVGALVVVYARHYLSDHDPLPRFYLTLVVFMFAMLGIALSDNLIVLLIFWELTSLSSFFLIGYWHTQPDSRRSARLALSITGGGGLALLAGVVLLGQIGGSYNVSELIAVHDRLIHDVRYPFALVLVLIGAFTKSAQFPFHFWLPAAMAAPTPVSAYLHSATMVKAGLLLVARLHPVLGGTELFISLVGGAGLITLVFAAAVATFKHDLKGLLAYSTVSHLGIIMFLLGVGTPMALVAAFTHILCHAAFKAALFMSAGIVDHATGTRDMRKLGGLWRVMPVTSALAAIAALAMAGVPPFNGFVSKELFFEQSLAIPQPVWLALFAPGLVTLGGVFSVAYSGRYLHDAFFNNQPYRMDTHPHEVGPGLRLPVLVLVVACVACGLAPAWLLQPLVGAVTGGLLPPGVPMPEFHLALWHGLNAPLAMSAVALTGGFLLYFVLLVPLRLHTRNDDVVSARRAFERMGRRVLLRAAEFTAALDRSSLQRTLVPIFAAAVGGPLLWVLCTPGVVFPGSGPMAMLPTDPLAWFVWVLALTGAIGCVAWRRNHVLMIVSAALVGLASVLAYAHFSAPDLALTQISVEVVSTLLLFMAMALMPRQSRALAPTHRRRWLHGGLAILSGLGVGWLAWLVMTRPGQSIAWYHLTNSYTGGGGNNVVNVTLVDFRGFDTMGEITVLAIAGLGVFAMLDGLHLERSRSSWFARFPEQRPLLLQVVAGWMLPLGLMVAVYVFLRGHNLPGGGFIAGLIASITLLAQYMARGFGSLESARPLHYDRLAGWGLLVAATTGAAALLFGRPFLTSITGHPLLGPLGEVGLASAAIFDLGVFGVVVGGTLLTVVTLARAGGVHEPGRAVSDALEPDAAAAGRAAVGPAAAGPAAQGAH